MAQRLMRVWRLLDSEDVGRQLLIVGELSAECANCKTIGIDHKKVTQCPSCKTVFRYIAARRSNGGVVRRLMSLHSDLIAIELEDFKSGEAKDRSQEFFGQ